jgi:hypothetical protein
MVNKEFEGGAKQIVSKKFQGIHHSQALALGCCIILLIIEDIMTRKVKWMIDIPLTKPCEDFS